VVLVATSDISALLAAHRVLSFDGESGLTVMAESNHPTRNIDRSLTFQVLRRRARAECSVCGGTGRLWRRSLGCGPRI
jgi:hypothetical protein